jgi:hypothetical protein
MKAIPQEQIASFCRRWKISELALFGSALRPDFSDSSDLDFLASFAADANWGLFDHAAMQGELQNLLGRKVDLLTRRSVERSANWIRRREILSTAKILYPAIGAPLES